MLPARNATCSRNVLNRHNAVHGANSAPGLAQTQKEEPEPTTHTVSTRYLDICVGDTSGYFQAYGAGTLTHTPVATAAEMPRGCFTPQNSVRAHAISAATVTPSTAVVTLFFHLIEAVAKRAGLHTHKSAVTHLGGQTACSTACLFPLPSFLVRFQSTGEFESSIFLFSSRARIRASRGNPSLPARHARRYCEAAGLTSKTERPTQPLHGITAKQSDRPMACRPRGWGWCATRHGRRLPTASGALYQLTDSASSRRSLIWVALSLVRFLWRSEIPASSCCRRALSRGIGVGSVGQLTRSPQHCKNRSHTNSTIYIVPEMGVVRKGSHISRVRLVGHTLWGYSSTYPGILGVPEHLPGYSGGTRVPTRVFWGYPSTYPGILGVPEHLPGYSGGTRAPTRAFWGYPSTYPGILGVPEYLPGY